MNFICDKNICTGCFACFNVCPVDCISMDEDEYGFVHYMIDEDRCIDCGRCLKVCPNNNENIFSRPQLAYAAWNNNLAIRDSCTSGGLATTISLHVISLGGIVYGASYIGNAIVKHIRVTTKPELEKLKGSKYVQSYIGDTFRRVKQDLKDKRYVAFIGTPCQIAGLKLFLNKEYENLVLIDLICHGVPSQQFLRDEIKHLSNDEIVDDISFRSNEGFNLELFRHGSLIKKVNKNKSMYYRSFMNALTYRESCYTCLFAQNERISDLTIGDFWGLGVDYECNYLHEKNNGISVALSNTEKGISIVNKIKQELFIDERAVEEANNGNSQLRNPAIRHKNRDYFLKVYPLVGFQRAAKRAMFFEISKDKIRDSLKKNKFIYKIYQKLKIHTRK